ncbi:MAG: NAD(P)/FAD-dependent oxidoreductase [Spirochaetales bacterium]|jgi:thioredoxin reductase|nr:NAD(P)/FAD-dependent oxidoreductase [Spirochaetales bacterium]
MERGMKKAQVVIVGGGPAGLCAAIEAAGAGARVVIIDENNSPGGQLFKQIHKFFGSFEHKAGMRGCTIGARLLEETKSLGVEVILNAPVYGLFKHEGGMVVSYAQDGREKAILGEKLILATGAGENALAFPGGTLPGVMGAGCAQTMINVNRVLPGKRIVMVGSGNVGLIVAYQLLQAGARVLALIEAAPYIGGYGVHASKIRRAGTPILVGHTITRAIGKAQVESVEITGLDENFQALAGTARVLEADTVCVAVGLSPLTELAWMAGCDFTWIPQLGGHIPIHNENMETTIAGVYAAGDITGSEEASTAMEEGRLAGIAAAEALGLAAGRTKEMKLEIWARMNALRTGPFGQRRFEAKTQLLGSARKAAQ